MSYHLRTPYIYCSYGIPYGSVGVNPWEPCKGATLTKGGSKANPLTLQPIKQTRVKKGKPAAAVRDFSRAVLNRHVVGRVQASEKIYTHVGHDERSGSEPDIRPTCPVANTRAIGSLASGKTKI
eukprot:scaffold30186_cov70-Phaeocystis_antarctica.AAC.5